MDRQQETLTHCFLLWRSHFLIKLMSKKIRELKQMLSQVGFTEVPGKGSHTNWVHPLYSGKITISGKDGADAKRY